MRRARSRRWVGYRGTNFGVWLGCGALQGTVRTGTPQTVAIMMGVYGNPGWQVFFDRSAPVFSRRPHYLTKQFDDTVKGRRVHCTIRDFDLPLWIPLLPLVLLVAVLIYRDRTRRIPGFCRKCGYNLTGNTTGRCPECGATVTGIVQPIGAQFNDGAS